MRKIYYRILLAKHRLLFSLGLKKHPIVKIWYDAELNNVLMFVDVRSGLFTIPCMYSDDYNESEWLATYTGMNKYGMFKNSTIYALKDIKKGIKDNV